MELNISRERQEELLKKICIKATIIIPSYEYNTRIKEIFDNGNK